MLLLDNGRFGTLAVAQTLSQVIRPNLEGYPCQPRLHTLCSRDICDEHRQQPMQAAASDKIQ